MRSALQWTPHFVFSCCAAITTAPAHATETLDNEVSLSAVVVTASGREQPLQDVQASVQVISSKDLEAYAGNSVTEALKLAAGVDARANGSSAFVAIRGIISNAGSPVLILVDGQRRTGKYGATSLNLMALEDIERIEIVRGPMSALYGADASGGIINIVTRKPSPGQPLSGSAALMAGAMSGSQRKTVNAGATLNIGTERTGHRVSLEQRSRGLFRYPGTPSTSYDLSEIDERYFGYDGVVRLAPGHEFGWSIESVDQDDTGPARTSRPPIQDFTGYERERRVTYGLRYSGVIQDGLLALHVSHGQSEASTTRTFPSIETTDYTQRQAEARYARDWNVHTFVAGASWRSEDLNVSVVPQVANTLNRSIYVQDELRFTPRWRLMAGARWDDFSTFGNQVTPRVSLAHLRGDWTFRATYGEAYRAPSVLEQHARFVRGRFLILGRSDIKPEKNASWEFAATFNGRRMHGEMVLFDSKVTNLIQSTTQPALAGDPAGVTTRSVYTNIGKADISGSELSLAWKISPAWSVTGGWDYLDARDGTTGDRLTHRARHTLRIGSRYERGAWRADLIGRYMKDYWASNYVVAPAAVPPPTASDFGTLDAKLSCAVDKTWTIALGIDNVADERQPANYSSTDSVQDPPGRFGYIQVRARF
jgi:outer membrane receptor for ferrienterochelin and colicin